MLWFILSMVALCMLVIVYIRFRKCGKSSATNIHRSSYPNIMRNINVGADNHGVHGGGDEDKARTYLGLALSNLELGNYKEAAKHIDAALAVDPQNECANKITNRIKRELSSDKAEDQAK